MKNVRLYHQSMEFIRSIEEGNPSLFQHWPIIMCHWMSRQHMDAQLSNKLRSKLQNINFCRPTIHQSLRFSSAAAAAAAEEVDEMLSADIPPNQTIYLNNLNEKVKKEGTALIRLHTPKNSS